MRQSPLSSYAVAWGKWARSFSLGGADKGPWQRNSHCQQQPGWQLWPMGGRLNCLWGESWLFSHLKRWLGILAVQNEFSVAASVSKIPVWFSLPLALLQSILFTTAEWYFKNRNWTVSPPWLKPRLLYVASRAQQGLVQAHLSCFSSNRQSSLL